MLSGNVDQSNLGGGVNFKQISDVEAFVYETERARKIPLSKEDIKRINDLAREAKNEDLDEERSSVVQVN